MRYGQILKQGSQGRRQLWYIAGREEALVQDAFELAKDHVYSGATSIAKTIYMGGEVSPEQLISRLTQRILEERSVVILLNAEAFKGWDIIEPTLRSLQKSHFFIAVSNESDINKEETHIRIFMNSTKVRLVECHKFSDDEALAWISGRLKIRPEACSYLLYQSRGDYEWLLNNIRKLQMMDGVITLSLVEKLFRDTGTPNLSDSLLKYRKRDAILSVRNDGIDSADLTILYDSVRKAALLREAINTSGYFTRHLVERTKLSATEVPILRPLAKKYDPVTVARLFSIILKMYPQLRAKDKWSWESLIFRW